MLNHYLKKIKEKENLFLSIEKIELELIKERDAWKKIQDKFGDEQMITDKIKEYTQKLIQFDNEFEKLTNDMTQLTSQSQKRGKLDNFRNSADTYQKEYLEKFRSVEDSLVKIFQTKDLPDPEIAQKKLKEITQERNENLNKIEEEHKTQLQKYNQLIGKLSHLKKELSSQELAQQSKEKLLSDLKGKDFYELVEY